MGNAPSTSSITSYKTIGPLKEAQYEELFGHPPIKTSKGPILASNSRSLRTNGFPVPDGFRRLIDDTVLEVFRHFVAMQDDGAFILTLVSRSWCAMVMTHPKLWRWVILDETYSDCTEKMNICAALSKPNKLRVTIRLPYRDLEPVIALSQRFEVLHIEVPEYMTNRDVYIETHRLLRVLETVKSCKVLWYHGDQEISNQHVKAFPVGLMDLISLNLTTGGWEHPHFTQATTIMPKTFSREEYRPINLLEFSSILDILQSAPSLQRFSISHLLIHPTSLDIGLPLVTMTHLQTLALTDVDFRYNRWISSLVDSIRAPNLLTFSISGDYSDVLSIMHFVCAIGNPTTVIMKLNGRRPQNQLHILDQQWNIRHVQNLELEVHGDVLDANDLSRLTTSLESLIVQFQGVRKAHLRLPLTSSSRASTTIIPCTHHFKQAGLMERQSVMCNGSDHNAPCVFEFVIVSSIGLWAPSIQELDFHLHLLQVPSKILVNASFPQLKTLKSTAYILVSFLSSCSSPNLQSIHLHWPEQTFLLGGRVEAELHYVDSEVLPYLSNHLCFLTKLHMLSFSWFPRWQPCIKLLSTINKLAESCRPLAIKLPAIPNIITQEALLSAMTGIEANDEYRLLPRPSFTKYSQSNDLFTAAVRLETGADISWKKRRAPCYFCQCSGVSCKLDFVSGGFYRCSHYSSGELVEISRNINTAPSLN